MLTAGRTQARPLANGREEPPSCAYRLPGNLWLKADPSGGKPKYATELATPTNPCTPGVSQKSIPRSAR